MPPTQPTSAADPEFAAPGLWRLILEGAPEGTLLLDARGKVVWANRRFAESLGYAREEVLGLSVWDWEATWSREDLLPMIEGLQDITFETRHRRQDGTTFDVEVTTTPVNWQGNFYRFCTCRDITQRKRDQLALQASETRYRTLFETESDAVFTVDVLTHRLLDANPAFSQLYGYRHAEALELTLQDLTTDTTPAQPLESPADALEWHRRKDQSVFPAEVSRSTWVDGDRAVHLIAVRDITPRQRIEQALRRSNSLLRATLEATVDGILAVDINGNAVEWNERFALLWRLPDASSTLDSSSPPPAERYSGFQPILQQVREPAAFLHQLELIRDKPEASNVEVLELTDGRTIEWHCRPQRAGDEVVGRVWSFRDITQRIAAESADRALTAQLLRSQDEERQRIARVLLASISPDLEALEAALRSATESGLPPDSPAARYLESASFLARQSATDARSMADLLCPEDLEKVGLIAATRARAADFSQRHGVPVELFVLDWPELPYAWEVSFLQVVQLALATPGQSTTPPADGLTFRFFLERQEAVLEIRGAGRTLAGLATTGLPSSVSHRLGRGPEVARERFRRLSGRLQIRSDSAGTCVTAALPLPPVSPSPAPPFPRSP